MTGVAVNVTEVPEQIVEPALLAIVTLVETVGFTVMVIPLLVAVLVVAQAREEVMTHVTTSPLVSELVLYVDELVPTFTPFTFHW